MSYLTTFCSVSWHTIIYQQRIHFKNCRHVPAGVRKRYDHYKQIDTSRGKVRYWESSAKKIGLANNQNRYVGGSKICQFVVFTNQISMQMLIFYVIPLLTFALYYLGRMVSFLPILHTRPPREPATLLP